LVFFSSKIQKWVVLDMGTIEAEAAMFGQPVHIRLASVIIGCRFVGQPHFMSTSIDLISAVMKV
jgi:aconitase A